MPERKKPEVVKSPLLFIKGEQSPSLFTDSGQRRDGRATDVLRPLHIETDLIHNATGSAYLEAGQTKVVCSIIGPMESAKKEFSMEGKIRCCLKFAPFAHKHIKESQEQREDHYSNIIAEAMKAAVRHEKFPKLQLDINVTVLEDSGNALSAAVNCTAVALATSGIEMKAIPTAATISLSTCGKCICDPTANEDFDISVHDKLEGSVTTIYFKSLGTLGGVHHLGCITMDNCTNIMDMCIDACVRVHQFIVEYLQHL